MIFVLRPCGTTQPHAIVTLLLQLRTGSILFFSFFPEPQTETDREKALVSADVMHSLDVSNTPFVLPFLSFRFLLFFHWWWVQSLCHSRPLYCTLPCLNCTLYATNALACSPHMRRAFNLLTQIMHRAIVFCGASNSNNAQRAWLDRIPTEHFLLCPDFRIEYAHRVAN